MHVFIAAKMDKGLRWLWCSCLLQVLWQFQRLNILVHPSVPDFTLNSLPAPPAADYEGEWGGGEKIRRCGSITDDQNRHDGNSADRLVDLRVTFNATGPDRRELYVQRAVISVRAGR